MTEPPKASAGWYLADPWTERYWNGDDCGTEKRPRGSQPPGSPSARQKVPGGWYPFDPVTERYWGGEDWGAETRPRASQQRGAPSAPGSEPAPRNQPAQQEKSERDSQIVLAAVLAAAAIGFVLSLQSASLMSGTGTIWTGTAIAIGAAVVAILLKWLPTWTRVVAIIAASIALANALYVEEQLEEKRQEINQIFD